MLDGIGGLPGLDGLKGAAYSAADMFVNLSSEYPDLLDAIFFIFAGCGVLITLPAVIEIIKSGDRNKQHSSVGSITSRMLFGSLLVDLAFWGKVLCDSLWSLDNPLGIESYANGGGDPSQVALYAVIGFMVLTGWVTLGRAFLMGGKLGYLTPDARSDLIGSIIARVAAGSAMVASIHLAGVFGDSTGFSLMPG